MKKLLLFYIILFSAPNLNAQSIFGATTTDGRFTLGTNDKRLMFGFPVPLSTSHFVIKIDSITLTNSPYFPKTPSLYYIQGKTTSAGSLAPKIETEYIFRDYKIVQTLMPMAKNLKDMLGGDIAAQYYRWSIAVTNKSKKSVNVGMIQLYDIMIDNNDACKIRVGEELVEKEKLSLKAQMPANIYIYQKADDPKLLMSELKPYLNRADAPDEMVIGNWPYLHSVLWDMIISTDNLYSDCAVLFRWKEKALKEGESVMHESIYGLPAAKPAALKIISHDPKILSKTVNIYFGLRESRLDYNGEMIVKDLIANTRKIKGVVLHGYSDAIDGNGGALEMSLARINIVSKIFATLKVPITYKSHGNYKADSSEEAMKKGNPFDRKVVVELFYEG